MGKNNHFQEKLDTITQTVKLGRWRLDPRRGTSKQNGDDNDPDAKRTVACSIPIVPTCLYRNLDSGIEKIELAYYKRGRWNTLITERSVTAGNNTILRLSDKGIEVNSGNAKQLVQYIAEVIGNSIDTMPYKDSKSVMGWVDDKFVPYTDDITFDADDLYKTIYDALDSKGTLDEWKQYVRTLRDNLGMRLTMAASFASPLVQLVGENPFVFHLHGGTGVGKTVALMVAASIYGNPENGKLVRTMNMTSNSMLGTAAFLRNLPFIGDELQTIKSRWDNYDNLIMCITEGIERGRMSYDRLNEVRSWKCAFLFTGEENCVKSSSGGGVKNRVIAFECNDKLVQNGNDTADFTRTHYGTAGRAFIEAVQKYNVQDMYRERFRDILDHTDTTDKQAGAMALIMTGDEIARELFFPSEPELTVNDVKPYLCSSQEVDVTERAFDFLMDTISQHPDYFTSEGRECWGKNETTKDEEFTYMNKTVLDNLLAKAGFDFDACKEKWCDEGYIVRAKDGRPTHKIYLRGVNARFIKIRMSTKPSAIENGGMAGAEMAEMVQLAPDDELPF